LLTYTVSMPVGCGGEQLWEEGVNCPGAWDMTELIPWDMGK